MTDATRFIRFGSLLVGIFGITVAGVIRSCNVFILPLKSKLAFTQTEIEFIAGLGNVGELLGLPAYLYFTKYGARWTSLLGLVLTFIGFLLLWTTTHLDHVFTKYFAAVAIFYFMASHGTVYTYISCMMTNIENFSLRHRWKARTSLELSHIVGTPVFASLFYGIFAQFINDGSNSLGNFFILVGICTTVVNMLGMVFLRNPSVGVVGDHFIVHSHLGHRDEHTNEYSSLLASNDSYHYSSTSTTSGTSSAVLVDDELPTLRTALLNWSVQYIMWTLTLSVGVGLMFYNNMTSILHSLNWDEHAASLTICLPLASISAHVIIVTTSDLLSPKIPKSTVMLILITILLGSQIFLIFYVDYFNVLVGACVMVYVATPCLISVGASLLRDRLAAGLFEKTWWTITSAVGAGSLVIQLSFGAIYDSYVISKRENDCFGPYCFMWSFILSSGVCVCACILNIGLIKSEW